MYRSFVLFVVLVLLLGGSSRAGDEAPSSAIHLTEARPEVRLLRVRRLESAPIQFALEVEVAMPEPMWKLAVDSVGEPDATGRVVVKLAGERPQGDLPQVITWTKLRVPLGALPVGDVLVDVFLETPPRPWRRVGAFPLQASR